MTAAETKKNEEEKHTYRDDEKMRKVGSKAQKQEDRTQGVSIVANLPRT